MRRERAIDIWIALGVFALTVAMLASGGVSSDSDSRSLDVPGVVLAAVASLPLVARRRSPLGVFAVTAVASAALAGLGYPPGPPLGPTLALFFVGLSGARSRTDGRLTLAVVGLLLVVHVAAAGIGRDQVPVVPALFGALVWGGAWVVGDRVRQRR